MTIRKLPAFQNVTLSESYAFQSPLSALDRWNAALRPSAVALAKTQNVIEILDIIGEDFFTGEGVTAKKIQQQLRTMNGPVTVLINSPGGVVDQGVTIYNALREYPGEVTVKILGIAASIATVIAMAGDRIEMAKAGFFMIHNAATIAIGDRHDMQATFDWLEMVDETMRDVYVQRSGLDAVKIGAMMDRETFLKGADAVDMGFADALLPGDELTESADTHAQVKPAAHRINALMAKAGCPKAERRKLFAEFKSGTSRAAEDDTSSAVVNASLAASLASIDIPL